MLPHRWIAPPLALALALTAVGCSRPGLRAAAPTSNLSGTPSSTPSTAQATAEATPSATPGEAAPVTYGMPRADYRRALRKLVRLENGSYRQSVQGYRGLSGVMFYLPEGEGSWDFAQPGFTTKVTGTDPGDNDYTIESRGIGDRFFVRADVEGSPFGKDCWTRFDPGASGTPEDLLLASEGGVPAALSILDQYRPAGRPGAGTTPLVAALSAVGFSKAAQALGTRDDLRVPINLTLRDETFYRATISPTDLLSSLDSIERPGQEVKALQAILRGAAPFYWTLRYSAFGTATALEAPPTDKIIGASETCPRGA